MAYNHGQEDRKWRIWKEAEEKVLRECGVDTLNKSAMDITPFRNILNEMYSTDVSVKIKSAYRTRFQQGKFMGTYAPYGYIKDPADHNHLLIDDKVAHVVREIFDLALVGNGNRSEQGESIRERTA